MRWYNEHIEVRRGMVAGVEAPHQILWRNRLYLVHDVLAHWCETSEWWRSPSARGVHGDDITPAGSSSGSSAGSGSAGSGPALPEPAVRSSWGLNDGEREVWRVEAAAGRLGHGAVLDIALDSADGRWRLMHAYD